MAFPREKFLLVDVGSGPLILWMALAFPSTYLIYLLNVRLQLEGESRTQWPELPSLQLLFSQLCECQGMNILTFPLGEYSTTSRAVQGY